MPSLWQYLLRLRKAESVLEDAWQCRQPLGRLQRQAGRPLGRPLALDGAEYARIPVGHGDNSVRWGTWWGRIGGGPPLVPADCVVPNLVGKRLVNGGSWPRTVASARVRRVKATKERKGRVLHQRPARGRRLASDSRIDLTVGR
jgi:hypothetical protein